MTTTTARPNAAPIKVPGRVGPANEHGHEEQPEQRRRQQVDHLVGDLQQVALDHADAGTEHDDEDADDHRDVLRQPDVIGFGLAVAAEAIDEVDRDDRARRVHAGRETRHRRRQQTRHDQSAEAGGHAEDDEPREQLVGVGDDGLSVGDEVGVRRK